MSMMSDDEVKVAFEAAITWMATNSTMVHAVAIALVMGEVRTVSAVRQIDNRTHNEVSETAQQSFFISSSSPSPSSDRLSWSDDE